MKTIAATLVGRLSAAATERAQRRPPASLAAYELVLRGDALPVYRPGATEEARALFKQAVALDPTYAKAYALLANLEITGWYRELDTSSGVLDRAFELAQKAVSLDPNDPASHIAVARVHQARGSYNLAEHHYRKALELNPNSAVHVAGFGDLHLSLGRPQEALAYFNQARQLDPYFDPSWFSPIVGLAHFLARDYEQAIIALERASEPAYWAHLFLAASHAMLGNEDRARHHAAETLRMKPDFTIARYLAKESLKQPSDHDHMREAFRQAGLPE